MTPVMPVPPEVPEVPWSTRTATPGDYPAFTRLFAELRVPDPIPSPTVFQLMLPNLIVATAGDEVVGYASWRTYGALVHVVNVVSAPERRGQGVGHALMAGIRERVIAAHATRWYLNVKRDNAAAMALYERHGMTIEGPAWALEYRWSLRENLPHSPPARVVTPNLNEVDEGDAEDKIGALGIVPDHLAAMAARGRIVLGLETDTLVACTAFDPHYPGAYPFAMRSPAHARALLDAIYPHRDPTHGDLVRIALDHDEALANLLLDHGATLSFALWRMQGSLL